VSWAASVWVRMTVHRESVRCVCSAMVPKLARDVVRERSEFVRVHSEACACACATRLCVCCLQWERGWRGTLLRVVLRSGSGGAKCRGKAGVGAFASRECAGKRVARCNAVGMIMVLLHIFWATYALASSHCANPLAFWHRPALGLVDASSRHVHRRSVGRQLHLASSWPPAMRTRAPTRRTIRGYSERR
jgi:hypothetical protein